MQLKNNFKVKYHRDGAVFSIKRLSGSVFKVSWDAGDWHTAGSAHYSNDVVYAMIRKGTWVLLEEVEDNISTRIAFFQQHIDALQENFESLCKAYEELKKSAQGGL